MTATTGFQPRSEPTRAAILAAARQLFREDGFAATTVRAIAAGAGVDPALVIRYFGSKRGMYEAAVHVDLELPDFSAVPRSRLGATMVREFLLRWDGERGEPLRILLAAATTDPDAAERMREIFAGQVRPAVDAVTSDDPAARSQLLATVLLGLAFTRYALRLEPAAGQSEADLVALFGPQLQRIVTRPLR